MIWQIDKYQLYLGKDGVCLWVTLLTPTPGLYCPCITKFTGIILSGSIFGAIGWATIGISDCLKGGLIGIVPGWG
jgi:hypothetical protein